MASETDLQIDDPVAITTTDEDELKGTVAHLGPVQFAPGSDWIGIRLADSYTGRGKNNGTVKGVFYFDAGGDNNGMFVRRSSVRKIGELDGEKQSSCKVSPTKKKPRVPSSVTGSPSPSCNSSVCSTDRKKSYSESGSISSLDRKKNSLVGSPGVTPRETFLRRLEQQQKSEEMEKQGSDNADEEGAKMKLESLVENISNAPSKESAIDSAAAAGESEVMKQTTSSLPRGNHDEDMAAVMSFLSGQSNLTPSQSSLDWIQDVDDSSLMFLKGLATADDVSGGIGKVVNQTSLDWVKDVDASSLVYLQGLASGNAAAGLGNVKGSSDKISTASPAALMKSPTGRNTHLEGPFKRASDGVLKERKIVQAARSPASTTNAQVVNSPTPATTSPGDTSSTELSVLAMLQKQNEQMQKMLTMIEERNNQIEQMQSTLDAMGNAMSQMSLDVRYLRDAQGHGVAPNQGETGGNVNRSLGSFLQRPPNPVTPASRVPPPPPPPPVPPPANQNSPNQNPPMAGGQAAAPPLQRGIFFPMFNYIFQCLASFFTNFRSILLSTGPGRVYNHIRNQVIQRRAFANVDIRALVKLIVMLAIFSGRLGRDNGGGRNRRANNARRVQENNNDEAQEEGVLAYIHGLYQSAVLLFKANRVPVLFFVTFMGFLIQSGLMLFMYEVFWVEREELLNAWLNRQNEAENDGNENNDTEGDVQAGGPQQDANARQPPAEGANPAAAARARPGPNPARGFQNARNNNRQANPNRRAGGMIRRGPNGGFLHDIQCLILSFVLSLIPAWKPEEAAPSDGEQQNVQQDQRPDPQQQIVNPVGGDGAQDD